MPSFHKSLPLPRRFAAICTTRCNFNCPHCIRQTLDERKTRFVDMPLSLFEQCLEEFKKINYGRVSFTGGEPILHPQFEKMISAATERNFTFNVVSNGWLYQDYFPILQKYRFFLTVIDFSLDGSTAEIHDKIRNKPGSYKRVIEAIKFYKKHGFYVAVCTCFNQVNLINAKDIYRLLVSLGVNGWHVSGVDDIIREQNIDYNLLDEERLFLWQEIHRLQDDSDGSNKLKIGFCAGVNPVDREKDIEFCNALSFYLGPTIYPDGSMIFCCDIYKNCLARPNIFKDGFWPAFKKTLESIQRLKLQRLKDIQEKNFFDGFNTCNYCNKYIEEILRDLKKDEHSEQ